DRCAVVGRPVVDDDALEIRIVEPPHAVEAPLQGPATVVRADNERDRRPIEATVEGPARSDLVERAGCGLRLAVAVGQPEVPAVHVAAVPMPLVCPREDEGAGAACGESR